jgi:4'-phosphopantetheinyl transferase
VTIVMQAEPAASRRSIDVNAIDVRVVELDALVDASADLAATLSADECARAARFVFERDRERFVICRGALRAVLGEYLGVAPAAVTFAYADRGKPYLPGRELSFNVTHTKGLALFAFSRTAPIGVDVESLDREVDAESLATRFFSADEARDFLSVPAGQRTEAFFNCWTRKESYIKAIGDGLSCPLHSFSVTLRPGDPAAIRWIDGDDASRWAMAAFQPVDGYVAAVSTPLTSPRLRVQTWSGLA